MMTVPADVADRAVAAAHAGLRVRVFARGDEAAWDRFVDGCRDATFFHRAAWRDVIENVFRHRCHYLLAESGNVVQGVLPLAEVRSRVFGHWLSSLPHCAYAGPIGTDPAVERALIDAAVDLGRSLRVSHLELRDRVAKRVDWPRQDLYVTFRKSLLGDVDANLLAVPRKQRAMIRKGIARGLHSERDAAPARFFALYADNVHRHGTPALPQRYFARLMETFGEACEITTIVDAGGRPVSGVLSFYFRNEVLPYYAGDTAEARALAANDFKYWALMRDACERGIEIFDFGRSKRGTGSFDFKRNWGFEPALLAYEYELYGGRAIPQNNPLNPRYRALIALWQRLPRPLVNAIGPSVARHLG